jgi:hypothetical protein
MGRWVGLPSVNFEERRKQPKPFGRIPENVRACHFIFAAQKLLFRRKNNLQRAEGRRWQK